MTKMTRTKLVVVRTNAKHARPKRLTDDELAEMIEEATVDAYGPSEQVSGFYTMLEEHLDLPFSTQVLGVDVVVERIDLTRSEEIVAICKRGPLHQTIPIRGGVRDDDRAVVVNFDALEEVHRIGDEVLVVPLDEQRAPRRRATLRCPRREVASAVVSLRGAVHATRIGPNAEVAHVEHPCELDAERHLEGEHVGVEAIEPP